MKRYYGVIYKATNKINGKIYIGKTIQPLNERINQHIYCANTKKAGIYFHNAINKYGRENFDWEIVDKYDSKEHLSLAEIEMIIKYNSFKCGYNISFGGDGNLGFRHSEKTKKQISKSNKGQKRTKETRCRISKALKGKIKSEAHCKNIGLANKGKKRSSEHNKKMISIISKNYKIITPEKEIIYVHGLKQFCREYIKEKLCDSSLIKVAKGKYKHHKGYLCEYVRSESNEL